MYWLYKKSKSLVLPDFDYTFANFNEFYELSKVIKIPLLKSAYNIKIKTDNYDALIEFIDRSSEFVFLQIYVEIEESLLKFIKMGRPSVTLLDSKTNWEVFEELVSAHEILFKHGAMKLFYNAIPHTYDDINAGLNEIKVMFPNQEIGEKELAQLFPIDSYIYPRQVLIAYLRLDRWRESKLNKCVDTFGNDLVLYAMRNNCKKIFESKVRYLKTGIGEGLVKQIPVKNLVSMMNLLWYDRRGFKDIGTILYIYERGETINDFVPRKTVSWN